MMDPSAIVAPGRTGKGDRPGLRAGSGRGPGHGRRALLKLELSSDAERKPWTVQIGQRVPKGAEEMVAPGRELIDAYLEVDNGDSVAVDLPRIDGRPIHLAFRFHARLSHKPA